MSILNSGIVPVGSAGYDIPYSARFNDDDSAYLSRTQGSGNRKTWTYSGWIKRASLVVGTSTAHPIHCWQNDAGNSDWDILRYTPSNWGGADKLDFQISGGSVAQLQTTQVFRDFSGWYHIVIAVDTTQATSNNRIKMYVNGERITSFSTENYPALNAETWANKSGRMSTVGSNYYGVANRFLDGYLAEVNFVDGQALTPADFGETDEDYGHWKAKRYTGTYGTNGFYLDFKNSGSLGNDANGSNNWTPNNLAATDQMLDSPTNNFATLNPVLGIGRQDQVTYSEGNLQAYHSATGGLDSTSVSTINLSGKIYTEFVAKTNAIGTYFGVMESDTSLTNSGVDTSSQDTIWIVRGDNGNKANNGTASYFGTAFSDGDIIQIAVDTDTGKVWWGRNGTWGASGNPATGTNAAYTNLTDDLLFICGDNYSSQTPTIVANFGQDSSFAGNKTAQGNADDNGYGDFYYTPPTGFLALCTQNLPEPTVVPSEHFNTVLYTGNTPTGQSITGVGFAPDLSWFKSRSVGDAHNLVDSVRGDNLRLRSNVTTAEASATVTLDSDGFTVGSQTESNTGSMVAWNWKANGAGVSNTNGTITSTVSANADAGFSIVSYTGNGTGGSTVGHGLSSAPEIIIEKKRSDADDWKIYTETVGATKALAFNTGTPITSTSYWQNTAPSSSVFTLGYGGHTNANGDTHIAYCFHSVEGYSKVGSYTGNSSADGAFVHCGFRPAYVMIKCYTNSGPDWIIRDSTRETSNVMTRKVTANSSASEDTYGSDTDTQTDFLSNGFKLRGSGNDANNASRSYIFIAFAEVDFKHSNAR